MTYFKIAEEVRVGETVHVTRIVDLGEECYGVGVCEALRGQGIPQSIRCTIAAVVHGFCIVRTRCDLHAMSQGLECLDTSPLTSAYKARQGKARQGKTRQDKVRQGWRVLTGGSDSCNWSVSSFFDTGGVKDARHTLIMHPSPMFKLLYLKLQRIAEEINQAIAFIKTEMAILVSMEQLLCCKNQSIGVLTDNIPAPQPSLQLQLSCTLQVRHLSSSRQDLRIF